MNFTTPTRLWQQFNKNCLLQSERNISLKHISNSLLFLGELVSLTLESFFLGCNVCKYVNWAIRTQVSNICCRSVDGCREEWTYWSVAHVISWQHSPVVFSWGTPMRLTYTADTSLTSWCCVSDHHSQVACALQSIHNASHTPSNCDGESAAHHLSPMSARLAHEQHGRRYRHTGQTAVQTKTLADVITHVTQATSDTVVQVKVKRLIFYST